MAKPSNTNYPKGFLLLPYLIPKLCQRYIGEAPMKKRRVLSKKLSTKRDLGGYSGEVPPLPIPNREVKLTNADGTAYLSGRVGSRLFKEQIERFAPFFCLCTNVTMDLPGPFLGTMTNINLPTPYLYILYIQQPRPQKRDRVVYLGCIF